MEKVWTPNFNARVSVVMDIMASDDYINKLKTNPDNTVIGNCFRNHNRKLVSFELDPYDKTDYLEAYFEFSAEIMRLADQGGNKISDLYQEQGRGSMWELAEELTNSFMEQNKDREWDGEFFDEVDSFIDKYLKS